MDSVTRQTGQHIEFEPEWEGAFNLQLKLEDNIAVIQEWCSTDVSAFVIRLFVDSIHIILGFSHLKGLKKVFLNIFSYRFQLS